MHVDIKLPGMVERAPIFNEWGSMARSLINGLENKEIYYKMVNTEEQGLHSKGM